MLTYFDLLNEIMIKGTQLAPRGKLIKELTNARLLMQSPHVTAAEANTGLIQRSPQLNFNFCATNPSRPLSKIAGYLTGELAWYFSGEREVARILPYSKFWDKIKNADGTANSNYGHRVFYERNDHGISPYGWVISCLACDPDSRQAIMIYNDKNFFYQGNQDFICTQYQHFMIRFNRLICIIGLRSSDAIYGLTYNMPWWSIVQQMVWLELSKTYPNLELGNIEINISSAHIYEPHYELVQNMLKEQKEYYFLRLKTLIPLGLGFTWYEKNIKDFLQMIKL